MYYKVTFRTNKNLLFSLIATDKWRLVYGNATELFEVTPILNSGIFAFDNLKAAFNYTAVYPLTPTTIVMGEGTVHPVNDLFTRVTDPYIWEDCAGDLNCFKRIMRYITDRGHSTLPEHTVLLKEFRGIRRLSFDEINLALQEEN